MMQKFLKKRLEEDKAGRKNGGEGMAEYRWWLRRKGGLFALLIIQIIPTRDKTKTYTIFKGRDRYKEHSKKVMKMKMGIFFICLFIIIAL